MVEAVGHADGDLVPVVERLEPRVRIARPDCPEDVGTPASDLPGRFDDFGDAAAGRPGHPMLQFAPGPSDRASEQTAQEFLELPGSAHGTDATTTPHPGQSTRGIMATGPTLQQPKSRCRQRRTPPLRP